MRIVFLTLLLANLGFFAWDRYLRTPLDADAHIKQVEITPEKIRLVGAPAVAAPAATSGTNPAASVQAPPAAVAAVSSSAAPVSKAAEDDSTKSKPAAACLEWGTFVGADIQRAEAVLAEAGFPAARIRRATTEQPGYWVLIPPQKSRAEATAITQQLKSQGVADFSIVQDPPEKRNAVSLGIFRTEDAARTLLAALQKKGVASALLDRREGFFKQASFYLRDPAADAVAKWNTLRAAVPGTDVRAGPCPAR